MQLSSISSLEHVAATIHLAASVNLDHIARDLDFDSLQENLSNIAFCNIELELVSLFQ